LNPELDLIQYIFNFFCKLTKLAKYFLVFRKKEFRILLVMSLG